MITFCTDFTRVLSYNASTIVLWSMSVHIPSLEIVTAENCSWFNITFICRSDCTVFCLEVNVISGKCIFKI